MADETNQTLEFETQEENQEDLDFEFDDLPEAVEAAEKAEELPGEEQPQAQPQAEGQPEETPQYNPKFKVKYNGQEQEMPLDQLIVNAQKGMNYDHVKSELDELRMGREFAVLDAYASLSGMTREQYLDSLQAELDGRKTQELVNQGFTEEAAKTYLKWQKDQQKNEERIRALEERARQAEKIQEFARAFPDVKEFPQEVAQAIVAGKDPIPTYNEWLVSHQAEEINTLQTKLMAYEKGAANKARAAGSVASDASDDYDAFLAGFNEA